MYIFLLLLWLLANNRITHLYEKLYLSKNVNFFYLNHLFSNFVRNIQHTNQGGQLEPKYFGSRGHNPPTWTRYPTPLVVNLTCVGL